MAAYKIDTWMAPCLSLEMLIDKMKTTFGLNQTNASNRERGRQNGVARSLLFSWPFGDFRRDHGVSRYCSCAVVCLRAHGRIHLHSALEA